MKISNDGIIFRLVDGGTHIMDSLPPAVYKYSFDKMSGPFLKQQSELDTRLSKIYGNVEGRSKKIFKTFGLRNRNLGILLSGEKGMGKSVFMRYMSSEAIKRGMPVITVNEMLPGISEYLSGIEQECLVLFDEFEKNFPKGGSFDCVPNDEAVGDDCGSQKEFLTLFDGMDCGKKMFIIAVNSTYNLSKFFINRPGRFYYHFRFGFLTMDETRDFVMDNLRDADEETVYRIVMLSKFHHITYDMLSSIVNELNNGFGLKETLEDLNIDFSSDSNYYEVTTSIKGHQLRAYTSLKIDGKPNRESIRMTSYDSPNNHVLSVVFDTDCVEMDRNTMELTVPKSSIKDIRILTELETMYGINPDAPNEHLSKDVVMADMAPLTLRLCDAGDCLGFGSILDTF